MDAKGEERLNMNRTRINNTRDGLKARSGLVRIGYMDN
jgi:hypothetical protein